MTPYQKRIKTFFQDVAPVCADQIVCKKSGAIEIKHSYFYHTQSSQEWARKITEALRMADIPATVTDRDDFANWPTTSYVVAIVNEA